MDNPNEPKIGVAMIARNAADLIPKALDPIVPYVDEIAKSKLRTISVLIHKPSIKEPEKFQERSERNEELLEVKIHPSFIFPYSDLTVMEFSRYSRF